VGGLKATLENFKKGTPLAKILKTILAKIWGKIVEFEGKTAKF
jgi:hypothetical protein